MRTVGGTVAFPVPVEVAFDYLVDPANRPQWQSSLKAVTDVDSGEPRTGLRWRDVTKVGVKPHMELTEVTPFRVLAERGTWRGVVGLLTLKFKRTSVGTRLVAEGSVTGTGVYAVAANAAGRLAAGEIRKDLERVGEILSTRG